MKGEVHLRLEEARRGMLEGGVRPSRWRFSPAFWGKILAAHSSDNSLVRMNAKTQQIDTVLGLPFSVMKTLNHDFELV